MTCKQSGYFKADFYRKRFWKRLLLEILTWIKIKWWELYFDKLLTGITHAVVVFFFFPRATSSIWWNGKDGHWSMLRLIRLTSHFKFRRFLRFHVSLNVASFAGTARGNPRRTSWTIGSSRRSSRSRFTTINHEKDKETVPALRP